MENFVTFMHETFDFCRPRDIAPPSVISAFFLDFGC